jgi:4-amino-4-deoxy-L-arabinose transferase-like glycosyltransferase
MSEGRDFFKNPILPLSIWAAYHLTVWTILPLLSNTCLPLDSIEAVMWGSQWEWGYDKHPPLSAWAPELFTTLLGDAGLYLLSQLCIVIAGLAIYKLGRLFKLTIRQCIFAVLLLDMIYYYQFISVEFNVNIMQLPFWAWGWFFGIDAIQNKRRSSWIGLGACIALGALTKYIAVFMLVPLFLAWWKRGELEEVLLSPGLYVAGVVSILLFLPHLIWMKNHDWITITYGLNRGGGEEGAWWNHLWYPLEFILGQAAILAPLIIVSICGKIRSKEPGEKIPGTMALGLGCFLFMAIFSLVSGMAPVTMWAAPMPLAIGIWLVPRFNLDRFPRTFFTFIVLLSLTFTIGYGVTYGAGHLIREKPHRVTYPGKALATAVEALWHSSYNTPRKYVVADEFLGGIVNHYGQDGAAVMISADPVRSTYLTTDDIRKHGAIILWLKSRRSDSEGQLKLEHLYPHLEDDFPTVEGHTDLIIPWPRRKDGLSGRYGIAYIAPESAHE